MYYILNFFLILLLPHLCPQCWNGRHVPTTEVSVSLVPEWQACPTTPGFVSAKKALCLLS